MIAARRLRWNFALQYAVDLARELRRPLVILEPLDADYPWASDRLHAFVLDGMAANARAAAGSAATYLAYVEPAAGRGRGLLQHLSTRAASIVTDWFPGFFIPRLLHAAGRQAACRVEAIDANGLIPLSAHGRAFTSARSYRAFVQRTLRDHLRDVPETTPLDRLPAGVEAPALGLAKRWRMTPEPGDRRNVTLAALPIDHTVAPVRTQGGSEAASRALNRFLSARLRRYAGEHNHPDADCTSRLSPYLHFGHISAHEVFAALMTRERWTTRRLGRRGGGARAGWWGVTESANVFLDQLVVWRELAFNGAEDLDGFGTLDAVPDWARATLRAHARDRRRRYELEALESASTDDLIWNAAQRQLAAEGWFHGYLRMLWGKKILEWSPSPQAALDRMSHLMNRYSLDGRDPVSQASFGWVLGLYDRPWPERDVFGTVRCMTSASAKRKLRMRNFLSRYGLETERRQE
jgi:deoxyribodipyrimidine photo-lyase